MRGLLSPGTLHPGASCCACAGCCGGGDSTCCSPPGWSTLGLGDPVSVIASSDDPCVWLTVPATTVLEGTGTSRVWSGGAGTAYAQIFGQTSTNCMGVTATSYTPAVGDSSSFGFFFASLNTSSDGADTTVFYTPNEGAVGLSLGVFAGTTHILELQICGGDLVYIVNGTVQLTLALALFPSLVTAAAAGLLPIKINASSTAELGPLTVDCTPIVPGGFLLLETGDFLLLETGDRILLET